MQRGAALFLRKKESFKFSDKKHSVRGLISLVMGILSCVCLLVLFYISSLSAGNGSLLLGAVGLVMCVLSIVGFIIGVKACKEKEIYYNVPIIGLVLNGFLSVIYLILYMLGISL